MFTLTNIRRHRSAPGQGRSVAGLMFACLLASGCAVGPNFHRPAPPKVDDYGAAMKAQRLDSDGAVQLIAPGSPTDPAWWRLFGSTALADLVAEGLKNSPTLAAARETLTQARDQARAGAGVFFPNAGVSASFERQQFAPEKLGEPARPSTFNLYTVTGSVGYVLDLFGGERRTVEGLLAAVDRQRYAVGAAYLTLTGNIVDTAIARAGYAEAAATLADIVRLDSDQRDIVRARFKAGYGAWADVLLAEQQLAADREALAGAEQKQAAAATLLQTLVGRETGETAPPAPALGDLGVPQAAPVSLPSQIVRRRPDILQAEAVLHQASAQVGVATAALFPSISITGDYGATSLSLGKLGSPQGVFWGVGPQLNMPLFEGGGLWYGRKAAQAGYRSAIASYRATVLSALEEVADSLKALNVDAEVAAANRAAFEAAATNHALGLANRQGGVIADYDAMSLQIQADRARLGLMAAKAQRLQDVVALYLASGGGWNGRDLGGPALAAAK